MKLSLKDVKLYIISPGVDRYKSRLLTVFERLVSNGFKNIEFVRSIPDSNGIDSLTRTNLHIMRNELTFGHCRPFIIIEDDIALFHDIDIIETPEDADCIYLGVSKWVYPHPYETLGRGFHIRENSSADVKDYNLDLTRMTGMTGGHGILFLNPEYVRKFINAMEPRLIFHTPHDLVHATLHPMFHIYALKNPLFYQDASLGGQEGVTKLLYNGTNYS
jgi:hypothetical protein